MPAGAVVQLELLLGALAAEPDPHTSVAGPRAALEVHVADSLSGLEVDDLREARRIADIGAGAGFPGLVLAIALPRAQVDLVESVGRKSAVSDRLLQAARVTGARTVTARAEDWARVLPAFGGGREAYDAVTARALAPLAVLAEYAAPLLRPGGALVAWKGARSAEEEEAGAAAVSRVGLSVGEVRAVTPYEGSREHHLHVFRKTAPTPPELPRRAGMARKRPLR